MIRGIPGDITVSTYINPYQSVSIRVKEIYSPSKIFKIPDSKGSRRIPEILIPGSHQKSIQKLVKNALRILQRLRGNGFGIYQKLLI